MTALRTLSLAAAPTEASRPETAFPVPRRAAPPPPVSDADLLAACRFGTRHARQLYARACGEWRERYLEAMQPARQAEAERIVQDALREVAGAVWMSVLLRRGLGGGRP
jgi:hypothetical protein